MKNFILAQSTENVIIVLNYASVQAIDFILDELHSSYILHVIDRLQSSFCATEGE